MISKLNKNSGMINCLTKSEMIKGKNGKTIFNNKWRKFDEQTNAAGVKCLGFAK